MNAIPEIRTSQRFAIVLSLLAVVATAIAVTVGSRVEDGLGSAAAATVFALLALVVVAGVVASVADFAATSDAAGSNAKK